jgi:hypothetical protein
MQRLDAEQRGETTGIAAEGESCESTAVRTDQSDPPNQERGSQPVDNPEPDNSDQDGQRRNNSDSPINSINKESLNTDSINTSTNQCRNFSDSPEDAEKQEVLRAFEDCGLRVNGRTMGLIPFLTGRQVRSAWQSLFVQGKQKETGILVTILEDMVSKRQRLDNDQVSRYSEWEE